MSQQLVKPIPKDLFKYTSFSNGEQILTNQTLQFSNPQDFNDPFDCMLENIYFDFSELLDSRVQKDLVQLRKEFAGHNLTNELLAEVYREVQLDKRNSIAVTCFSLQEVNLLLWAHYANKHTGMCLHFDNTLPEGSKFRELHIDVQGHMEYHLEGKFNYCSDKLRGIKYVYLNKSHHWEYEDEFRLITQKGEGCYAFQPKFLRAVIFGLKTSETDRKRVMTLCRHSGRGHLSFLLAEKNGPELVYRLLT